MFQVEDIVFEKKAGVQFFIWLSNAKIEFNMKQILKFLKKCKILFPSLLMYTFITY